MIIVSDIPILPLHTTQGHMKKMMKHILEERYIWKSVIRLCLNMMICTLYLSWICLRKFWANSISGNYQQPAGASPLPWIIWMNRLRIFLTDLNLFIYLFNIHLWRNDPKWNSWSNSHCSCGRALPHPIFPPACQWEDIQAINRTQVLTSKLNFVFYLTGHISITGHVAIAIVSNVGGNLLVKRREGGDVGVRLFVNNRHLK